LLGWLLVAAFNTAWLCATSAGTLSFASRAVLCLYDFAQAAILGLLVSAAVVAFGRWVRPRVGRRGALTGWLFASALAALAGVALLGDDLAGAASRLVGGRDSALVRALVCAGAALAVPASFAFGQRFGRGPWRLLPMSLGLLAALANQLVLVGDYAGVHLLAGAIAASLLGSATIGVRVPASKRSKRIALPVLVGLALLVALAAPPASIVAPLARVWTAALAPALPRTWLIQSGGSGVGAVYEPGIDGGPVPPSEQRLTPGNPIVIVITVDSVRADVLDEGHGDDLPNLHRLKQESWWFQNARSPGTQTAITLTSMMMGTYYSQQYWTPCFVPEGTGVRVLFAHEDDGVHFPELLSRAGVPTVQFGQAIWLEGKYGMTRGFSEHRTVPPVPGKPSTKGKWSTGDDVWPLLLARLRSHGDGPLFVFFHDLDPHAPFDLGDVKTPARAAYLSELKRVDARLGQLLDSLKQSGLERRTVLVWSSDHGEAFGEHGTSFHGQNLYEEQVRVPLLVRLPSGRGAVSKEPVSLIDIGPTVLDLFGLPTPGHFMGQSLVPLLAGEDVEFRRPIVAEGRLKQAMVLPNGLKLIRNQKEGTFEIYDLTKDPAEQHNLYDVMGPEGPTRMQELIAFFERHRIRRQGYEVPYRR
jgi:arylsulfatase A-like enzyme